MELVSFDIESMYPSVDVNKSIAVAVREAKSLGETFVKSHGITAETFGELLALAAVNYVSFSEVLWLQKVGWPIGGPLSGAICSLYIEDVEQRAIIDFLDGEGELQFYSRYVDDTCCLTSDPDKLLTSLNSIDPGIRFTIERASSCVPPDISMHCKGTPAKVIAFLQFTLVLCEDGSLELAPYRKKCYIDYLVPPSSAIPYAQRKSGAVALLHQAVHLFDEQFQAAEVERVRIMSLRNGYSVKMFEEAKQIAFKDSYTASETVWLDTPDARYQGKVINVVVERVFPMNYVLVRSGQRYCLVTRERIRKCVVQKSPPVRFHRGKCPKMSPFGPPPASWMDWESMTAEQVSKLDTWSTEKLKPPPIPPCVVVPYVRPLVSGLRDAFKKDVLNVTARSSPLRSLFVAKLKDKCPKEMPTGCIYVRACSCGNVYVGETIRDAKIRQAEHNREVKKLSLGSALSAHVRAAMLERPREVHNLFEGAAILHKGLGYKRKRLFFEAWSGKAFENMVLMNNEYEKAIKSADKHVKLLWLNDHWSALARRWHILHGTASRKMIIVLNGKKLARGDVKSLFE